MTSKRPRSEKFDKGMATRRAVLGDAYVDAALAEADDFIWPLHEIVTEYCWDEVWNRPGLDRRSRSLLNLGMLAALNRQQELKVQIQGAIRNGLTREEIREALLQALIYCGAPASIDAFRTARAALAEMKDLPADAP